MQTINVCRNIFDYIFIGATLCFVIMSFVESVPKGKRVVKSDLEIPKEEKWYDILQITIDIVALVVFLLLVIYGLYDKKFLWLFVLIGISAFLDKIVDAFVSVGIVGDVVKANDEGTLSFREYAAILFISSIMLLLQSADCFEWGTEYVKNYFASTTSDLLLLLMYVLTIFVYIFLTCSLVPLLMLFGAKMFKKLVACVPGREKLKKCGDFFTERVDRPIKQSQMTILFLERIRVRNAFIKIFCIIVIVVVFIMDVAIFIFNVVCYIIISSIGYIVIIYRMVKKILKNVLVTIFKLSDKKIVAVSFRIAIIAALAITVITNRYDMFVKNADESTAVLEFVASSIIIPVVFEWINSGKKDIEKEKTKNSL